VYYNVVDPSGASNAMVGSSAPVHVILPAHVPQYPSHQASRLAVMPLGADSHGGGPTAPAQVV